MYVTNKDLMREFLLSREQGHMTEDLGKMVTTIAERFAMKPSYNQYSFREDMVQAAVTNIVANWNKFDPEKGSNLFAYYTTCVYRTFVFYIKEEKKEGMAKDALAQDGGRGVSWRWQDEAALSE